MRAATVDAQRGQYAHSRPGRPPEEWEELSEHAEAVGAAAAALAARFGWGEAGSAAGILHDAGKCSAEFQAHLRASEGERRRVDHSTHGARIAAGRYNILGRLIAACIAGHHAGLPDPDELDRRLDPAHPIPRASNWAECVPPPPDTVRPTGKMTAGTAEQKAFSAALLTRMLFSCLADADFLETERFMSADAVHRGVAVSLAELRDALASYMASKERVAGDSDLNALRARVRTHAVARASAAPGLFTLTVPTGGGKTLTSLGFVLEHALCHAKRRIIYVIPFTSIIEQTAAVFRDVFGRDDIVLEHHASFDWERAAREADGGDERDGLGVLRRAAENWDAPIVVTTAVQFFESLFAARTSSCRKLHDIADSVVILDEAQMLPTRLLLPGLAALRELTVNYGVSAVLCTATQPALRARDGVLTDRAGRSLGLDIPDGRELAPDPPALYAQLRRVYVKVRDGETDDEAIGARFAESRQMLCIVNTRAHARELFDRIADLPGAVHLNTLMCPAHRSQVLAGLRERLQRNEPVRLVSTSLIEAGVDISFPEVWRAQTGVDSIVQAAGRCNREGEMLPELGRVVVFSPAGRAVPRSLQSFLAAGRGVLRDHVDDPLALDAVRAYFRQLYFHKGIEALDAAEVGERLGVLHAIEDGANRFRYPFRSIAEAFRMIEDAMQPVVVPWNREAEAALGRVAFADKPSRADFRALQRFTVSIPKRACEEWLGAGVILPVRRDLGNALLRFADASLYREMTGIDLANSTYRNADLNIFA